MCAYFYFFRVLLLAFAHLLHAKTLPRFISLPLSPFFSPLFPPFFSPLMLLLWSSETLFFALTFDNKLIGNLAVATNFSHPHFGLPCRNIIPLFYFLVYGHCRSRLVRGGVFFLSFWPPYNTDNFVFRGPIPWSLDCFITSCRAAYSPP